jgi:thiamine kinase-like enzyme
LREYLRLHNVRDGEDVLARLDVQPPTLCHNDLHPGNVLGELGEVVIDWPYCGLGSAGLDAGVLVADGIADAAFPAEQADEVAAAVWTGYLEGLGGAFDEADVRFAFARGTALRLSWLPRGERAPWDATIAFLERLASDA